MMTTDEDWVKEAMTDDAVVVEMLLRLHAAQIPSTPKRKAAAPPLQLEWTVRQRRSRPAIRHLADSSNNNSNSSIKKKKGEATRASPTTPLSWSGATSQSGGGGGADGFEESSRPARPLDSARSKVVAGTSETTTTKRSRKKKTLAELREEESMLLKERRSLKTELTTLRQRLENQRATNESLKRMKMDLQSQQTFKPVTSSVASEETISDQLQHLEAASHPTTSKPADVGNLSLLQSSFEAEEVESQDTGFLLPDLNVALEEDSCPKVICGMS